MRNVGKGIEITSYYVMGGESATVEEPVSRRTPVFRNIAISNIAIQGARQVADIGGLPEMPIDGLRISNVTASGRVGLSARFTRDFELHNVTVDAAQGPAFAMYSSTGLEADNVTTRAPQPNSPVLRLDGCAGAIVRDSHAAPRTGTFLSTAPGELKSIQLIGNDLRNAQTATEERATN